MVTGDDSIATYVFAHWAAVCFFFNAQANDVSSMERWMNMLMLKQLEAQVSRLLADTSRVEVRPSVSLLYYPR